MMPGAFPKGLYHIVCNQITGLFSPVTAPTDKLAIRTPDGLWLNTLFLAVSMHLMDHLKLASVLSEIKSSASYTFCTFVFIIHLWLSSTLGFSHGFQRQLFQPENDKKIFLNVRPASNKPKYKNPAGSLHLLKCTQ